MWILNTEQFCSQQTNKHGPSSAWCVSPSQHLASWGQLTAQSSPSNGWCFVLPSPLSTSYSPTRSLTEHQVHFLTNHSIVGVNINNSTFLTNTISLVQVTFIGIKNRSESSMMLWKWYPANPSGFSFVWQREKINILFLPPSLPLSLPNLFLSLFHSPPGCAGL